MLTRTPNDLSRRSQAQRRLRRAATQRLFCSTNGCPTYLEMQADGSSATCPICGFSRNLGSPSASRPN